MRKASRFESKMDVGSGKSKPNKRSHMDQGEVYEHQVLRR
ncbi:unnamed protein product [Brassica oleracea]